ncbi:MAG: YbbR-like domain-containing protein [Perlabentimonas sp.]
MDTDLLKQFGQVFSRQRANLKVRLAIFSFFLVVATILWYLNKLSYEYTTEVTFPLELENTPRGKVIVGDVPEEIILNVRGHGYTLLRYWLASRLTPIKIDLNRLPLERMDGSENKFYLLTSRAQSTVTSQLKTELQLDRIIPDQLHFEFAELKEKKVKVVPQLTYSFEPQYMLAGPVTVNPDSIIISGPNSIVDTINSVSTKELDVDNITSKQTLTSEIVRIDQVSLSKRNVNITIPSEKFTEASFSKPIAIRNLPDTLSLILLPRMVNVKCNVVLSKYRTVSDMYVEAYVDFLQVENSMDNRLRVQVKGEKYIVDNLDFEPRHVEYFIEHQ